MLTLDGITLRQGDFNLGADFTVPTGARVAVVGPSGAGKSTLLNAVAGFLRPDSGRVLWNGTDLTALRPGDRPVSVIFQDQNLFPHLSIEDNVGLGLRPSLGLSAADRARVAEALARVGLEGLGKRRPAALSGGQQSRVALARMVLRGKPLALMDEPFSALGPALKAEMLDLVAALARAEALTLMMVTQDPEDARRMASHVVLVDAGRALPPVETETLFAAPPEAFRHYLGTSGQ
jgi:thiamine transport system ATP-binding protein